MRRSLLIFGFLLGLFVLVFFAARSNGIPGSKVEARRSGTDEPSNFKPETSYKPLNALFENPPVLDGAPLRPGLPREAIPAIDRPKFISVVEANIEPNTSVMAVTVNRETHVYETKLLARHEIVNDTIGGKPVLCSY